MGSWAEATEVKRSYKKPGQRPGFVTLRGYSGQRSNWTESNSSLLRLHDDVGLDLDQCSVRNIAINAYQRAGRQFLPGIKLETCLVNDRQGRRKRHSTGRKGDQRILERDPGESQEEQPADHRAGRVRPTKRGCWGSAR